LHKTNKFISAFSQLDKQVHGIVKFSARQQMAKRQNFMKELT